MDGDGRLDSVVLHLRPPGTRLARSEVRVRAYSLRRLARLGPNRVRLVLTERPRFDTGFSPMVLLRGVTRRAADGAGPVLVDMRPSVDGALLLRWSEAVSYAGPGRPLFVLEGPAGRTARVAASKSPRGSLLRLRQPTALRAPLSIRYFGGGAVRDRAGNPAHAGTRIAAARSPSQSTGRENVLAKPIDPRHQTALDFGERSHWLQPWRAYLDTWPAARLSGGIGINFNVPPEEAETYAALLGNAGFRHARVEVPWASLRYDDPSRFQAPAEARYTTILTALRRHEIRPLILLNAHHGAPCPLRRFDARVSGKAGSRTITLETDEPILPGRKGLDSMTTYLAAEYLVVAWNGSEAVLSKPLERDVDGMVTMTTLRYAPFDVPGTPGFEQTLAGWLQYVEAVSTLASTIVGPSGYDLEVWNEISFGSNFMDLGHYYERGAGRWIDAQGAALTRRTVEWARSSLSPGVGISDGFASQIPWPSGARNQAGDPQPLGLTALSKHLYAGAKTYPGGANPASVPLGALGTFTGGRMGSRLCCYFEPSYTAHFPEYYLSGLQTETAIRDLSPIPSSIHGRRHGRYTKPSGGTPPALWMTEINMEADDWEAKAKIALRYYVSWIGKGVERLYLFAAHESGGAFAVVDPEQAEGGHVLRALARLSGVLRTAQPITVPRPVSVAQIADSHGAFQFRGNDTAGYPPLYDREVLFVQPFQLADQRFLISVHVATRNALQPYSPKPFSITLAGVSGHTASLTAVDPLSGGPVPVTVLERDRRSIRFSLPVGDAPRLVTLVDEAVPRRHR